jgi:hypothetical protein
MPVQLRARRVMPGVRCFLVKSNDMKFFLSFIFIALLLFPVFAQTEQEKEVRLPPKAMKERIVKQEFSDVPQSVKDCHGRGTFTFFVKVDTEGKVKSAKLVSGLCKAVNEYIEMTVTNWKFKPLKVAEKKTPFRGVIQIPFCYGSFGSCGY